MIPLDELHPFAHHPFKVKDDEAMQDTVESVKAYGVLVPAIARPREEGGYELVAGHRRHRASLLAGLEEMPVIVRELDDDEATIIMVDSNLQREYAAAQRAGVCVSDEAGGDEKTRRKGGLNFPTSCREVRNSRCDW